jgi:hypothetical protein
MLFFFVVLAVGVAVLGPSSGIGHRAIDLQFHDTMFVVAHFHVTAILAAGVVSATLVAMCCRTMNGLLGAAWGLLAIGGVLGEIPWTDGTAPARMATSPLSPSGVARPGLYVWVMALGTLACVGGFVASAVRALRRSGSDTNRPSGGGHADGDLEHRRDRDDDGPSAGHDGD